MPRQKLTTDVRREQIAEAALRLIAAQGIRRLSIAAVARRVGLVPSGIYRHFKNKDELLDAVLELVDQRLQGLVSAARQEVEEPLGRLELILRKHVEFIREGRAFPRLVFSEEVHAGHPARRERMRQIVDGYLGAIAEVIREGQEEGVLRADLDPKTVAIMFLGTVMPAAILWHLSDEEFDVTRHAHRVWPLFRRAVTVDIPEQPK